MDYDIFVSIQLEIMVNNDKPEAPTEKSQKWLRWAKIIMWTAVLGGFLLMGLLLYIASQDNLPTFEDLENPQYNEASIIYDTQGRQYGKYYIENREPILFKDLSPHVLNSLLSIEDVRYYSHSGIDIIALSRVAFKTLLMGKSSSGGGSTISQQLAKLLFSRPNLSKKSKLSRMMAMVNIKLKEWITAVKLERSYTKEEIIQMYLNKFEFINGAHGIKAAAETYFNKDQKDLNVEEAALLVGMLKNPSLYNPKRFPDNAKARRNTVLSKLYDEGHIDNTQRDTLFLKEVDMASFERKSQSEGPAPYFRSELTKWLRATFDKMNIRKDDGQPYNIYTDGLKIYTTIDLDYQRNAENALWEHMKWNQQRYWKVWRNRNPWTYDTTPEQKEIRRDVLQRQMKSSERYLSLRQKVLGKVLDKALAAFPDLPLSDNVLKELFRIDKGLTTWKYSKKLKKEHIATYKKLVSSDYFGELKNQWQSLEKQYEKAFSTKVEMEVFDYTDGKKTVTWTPEDSVKYYSQHLQGGLLAVDPHTGDIKAWVGGINHEHFKYDHVNTRRQVGSTIKPFVYATAISLQNLSPCTKFADIPYTINPGEAAFQTQNPWSPANANGEFSNNNYNLYQGLLYSKNSITVALVKQMGNVEVIRTLMDNAGISKDLKLADGRHAVPEVPSISLGAVDLTLSEMTGAYTVFANNGVYTQPTFVSKIEDKNGRVIYTGVPERKTALDPFNNAIMVDMLRNNVAGKHGLGIKVPAGGKTGTTNDYTDGWFMGITPNLVVGVWTGGDDPWIRFTTLDDGQGYVMARPMFSKFIKNLEKDTSVHFDSDATFARPPAGFEAYIDCDKYNVESPEELQEIRQKKLEAIDEYEEEFDEFSDDGFGDDTFGEEEFEKDDSSNSPPDPQSTNTPITNQPSPPELENEINDTKKAKEEE